MKKTNKLLIGALSVLAIGAITSCSGKQANTIIVGITDYPPMDYRDETTKEWTGFDAELSKKVFGELGYTVQFQLINWDSKNVELTSKAIDCIWNGMTITDELKEAFAITDPYLSNYQYGVTKTENKDNYSSLADCNNKKVAVEGGSAAYDVISGYKKETTGFTCEIVGTSNQNAALTEVYAGTSDIAIVDYTLAKTLLSEGTTYYGKLSPVNLGLEPENFGIAFRKADSELCTKVNNKINELYTSGYMSTLAAKYGISGQLVK